LVEEDRIFQGLVLPAMVLVNDQDLETTFLEWPVLVFLQIAPDFKLETSTGHLSSGI
jgi:hypothetical protein